jgi:hypothetical protein
MNRPRDPWVPSPSASIQATFQPQKWGGPKGDYAEEDGQARRYDVTENVLALPLGDLRKIEDNADSSDRVVPYAMHRHDGPFFVNVEQSLCEFFDVDGVEQISQQRLDAARKARRVGEERDFEVELTRIATRTARVEVRATSAQQAQAMALEMAGDVAFSSENHYEVKVEQVAEMDDVVVPRRPKP